MPSFATSAHRARRRLYPLQRAVKEEVAHSQADGAAHHRTAHFETSVKTASIKETPIKETSVKSGDRVKKALTTSVRNTLRALSAFEARSGFRPREQARTKTVKSDGAVTREEAVSSAPSARRARATIQKIDASVAKDRGKDRVKDGVKDGVKDEPSRSRMQHQNERHTLARERFLHATSETLTTPRRALERGRVDFASGLGTTSHGEREPGGRKNPVTESGAPRAQDRSAGERTSKRAQEKVRLEGLRQRAQEGVDKEKRGKSGGAAP
jgi:hypothetical protein